MARHNCVTGNSVYTVYNILVDIITTIIRDSETFFISMVAGYHPVYRVHYKGGTVLTNDEKAVTFSIKYKLSLKSFQSKVKRLERAKIFGYINVLVGGERSRENVYILQSENGMEE